MRVEKEVWFSAAFASGATTNTGITPAIEKGVN